MTTPNRAVTGVIRTKPSARSRLLSTRFARILVGAWLPILILVAWWFASADSTVPQFPPLQVILQGVWKQWVLGDAWMNIVSSGWKLLAGYGIGCLLGIIGGSLLWRFLSLRRATNPIVYFLYVLPAPALLPALIALFGIGPARQIALIAFGALWPTLLNTLDGMRGIDSVKFDTARALRLGGRRTYFRVVLPAAMPQIFAGLRGSLTVSIILMVVSEMVAANSGIGYYILQAQAAFATRDVWAGIIVLALLGVILNGLFVLIEHGVLRWYYRSRAAR